jgi:hypothetical protein
MDEPIPLLDSLRDLARRFPEQEIREFFLLWIEQIAQATRVEDVPGYQNTIEAEEVDLLEKMFIL